jgi:hypothetical protein
MKTKEYVIYKNVVTQGGTEKLPQPWSVSDKPNNGGPSHSYNGETYYMSSRPMTPRDYKSAWYRNMSADQKINFKKDGTI